MTEQELQELIDAGLIDKEKDKELYEHLYKDLSSEIKDYKVSTHFIKNLSGELEKAKKQSRREMLILYSVVGFMGLVALVLFLILTKPSINSGLSNWLAYTLIFSALYFVFRAIEKKYIAKES
ncbi:hypothetical protein [Fulvivirga lutea]|uniref:Uncharacterized protein n=1 Tax=Fulvivirga lutea TaxID=2810512 RepID=A0A974WG07_9BACT|nr:hypothetical protein [Fulvivirga lutea]QSE97129.1 hypothetical protein JR347_16280 [Fulvivirga lutea]